VFSREAWGEQNLPASTGTCNTLHAILQGWRMMRAVATARGMAVLAHVATGGSLTPGVSVPLLGTAGGTALRWSSGDRATAPGSPSTANPACAGWASVRLVRRK